MKMSNFSNVNLPHVFILLMQFPKKFAKNLKYLTNSKFRIKNLNHVKNLIKSNVTSYYSSWYLVIVHSIIFYIKCIMYKPLTLEWLKLPPPEKIRLKF